jgi:hypothetical protein
MRDAYKDMFENPKGKDHAEDLGVDGNISHWILGE